MDLIIPARSPEWLSVAPLRFFLAATVLPLVVFAAFAAGVDGREVGRVGCPHCRNDGSRISQLLLKADRLYAELKVKEALLELFRVLQLDPRNHEALSKIARAYIDLGDRIPESEANWQEKRLKQYRIAEQYARKAVEADPDSTWGHFYVAASLGKVAMLSPITEQIDLSKEILSEVEKAIACDPANGFAYHIYGVWHRKMAEVGQMRRALANVVLWRTVPDGSLEKSVEYLNKAISVNPRVIVHHLELGRTYIAMGDWQRARRALSQVQQLPGKFSDDQRHKREARELLREIKDR